MYTTRVCVGASIYLCSAYLYTHSLKVDRLRLDTNQQATFSVAAARAIFSVSQHRVFRSHEGSQRLDTWAACWLRKCPGDVWRFLVRMEPLKNGFVEWSTPPQFKVYHNVPCLQWPMKPSSLLK